MRNLLIIILALFSVLLFAQQDLEQSRDDLVFEESGRALLFVNVRQPFAHFSSGDCAAGENFVPAKYALGDEVYKRELERYILGYIDRERYQLQGSFYLTLTLDASGQIKEMFLGPNVQNSRYFFDDLRFVVRRIKDRWIPAKCGSTNTESRIRIQMNFNSDVAE